MHWRQYRTTEDSHNQTGSTELRIVAHTLQGDTIDGGEHQRHTCRNSYQAVHTCSVLEEDDTASEDASSHCQDTQQHTCIQVTQHKGTDKAATAENHHRYDVVCLRQYFCIEFGHAFCHEDSCTVLDYECPAHNLCTYIEELGNDTFAITLHAEDTLQSRKEVDFLRLVTVLRHLGEVDYQEHHCNHQTDNQIRTNQYAEVGLLQGFELFTREQGAFVRFHRVELGLDEVHRYIHTEQGAHRIERLGEIQSAGSCCFIAHREDVWVRTGFEERETASQDKVGEEERIVFACHLGREEEQCADGVHTQSHQDTCLIGILADEHGSRKGHGEIATIEGNLHQSTIRHTHAEDFGERLHHRVGDVVGESPQCKT